MSRTCVTAWLGVVVSIFTTVFFGLELAFNVYAVPLKQTFNFTQTEVELVSVSGLAGMGASLIEPFITSRFGYKTGYLAIWTTTVASALLMGVVVVFRDFTQKWPLLVCLLQFLMNAGQNAGSSRLTTTSIQRFPEHHTGTLVGLGFAAISAGKIVYGGLLDLVFRQDLQWFFTTVAIMQAMSFGVCFVIHRPDGRPIEPRLDETPAEVTPHGHMAFQQDVTPASLHEDACEKRDNPVTDMIASKYFHLIFWPSAVIYCGVFTYINNLTFIAHSIGLDEPMNVVYVLSIVIITGRLICGWLLDKSKSNACGFILLLTGSLSTVVAITLMVLQLRKNTLYIATLLLGVGMSVGISIPTTLITMRFGQQSLAYTIGCIYCLTGVLGLVFQFLIGLLYDQTADSDGFCYGPLCFFMSSLILLIFMVLSTLAHVISFIISCSAPDT